MLRRFQRFWEKESNLLLLLIVLSIHMFVIIPLGRQGFISKRAGFVFYIFLLAAASRYLSDNKKFGFIFIVSTVCIVLLLAIGVFFEEDWVTILSSISLIFFCSILAWIVLLRTFSAGPITIYRIEGSIVVYLLLGLIFANAYETVYLFYHESAFKGLAGRDIREFQYFSLVTLTTVGYGDITPAIPVSRSLANLEALMGQLYPAILIARLVSMEIAERK